MKTPCCARAASIRPAYNIYLVNDPTVNSFVAEGQNMFIQTGMIMFAKNSLELKGVMAHETGHIVAGHLVARHARRSRRR